MVRLTISKKLSLLLCLILSVFYFSGVWYYLQEKEALLIQNKHYELLKIASELDRAIDDTALATDISETKHAPASQQDKVLSLNKKYQTYVDAMTEKYPNYGFGIYCRELNQTIAIGPNFSADNLRTTSLPQILLTYQLGQPQYVEIEISDGWNGQPVLTTTYPIVSQGTIIGHTWASAKKQDVLQQIQHDKTNLLALFVILWLILIGIISLIFDHLNKMVAKLVVQIKNREDDTSTFASFPELIPIIEEINELKKKLAKENDEREKLTLDMEKVSRTALISEMAATVAHEIRNPMQVIQGYTELLMRKSDVKYRSQYGVMLQELARMNTIITNYLSLTRSKKTRRQPENLDAVIRNITPLIQAEASNRGVEFSVQLNSEKPVCIDEKEIKQVILNLCRNAFDATNENVVKKVAIQTYWENNTVILSVADNGVGIEPENVNNIFLPLYTTKEDGTGLGLSVCRSILDRHKARIEVCSEIGQGTTFFILFKPVEAS